MSASYSNLEPPLWRRRDDLESSLEEIVKNETLYLENGNVVIFSLPKDNIITAFKVYRDYLSLQSAVFEGMFSIPSPPNLEMYDNVPLVRLQDEADDLLHFLAAIHDPTAVPTKKDFFISVEKVRSVFKLSKKYQADKLLTCVKGTLSEIWPKNLLEWDNVNYHALGQGVGYDRSALPEPCYTIALARDHDMPEILPVAFYHLFRSLPRAFSATNPQDGEHWGLNSSRQVHSDINFHHLPRVEMMHLFHGSYAIRGYVSNLFEETLDFMLEIRGDCVMNDPPCIEAVRRVTIKHVGDMYQAEEPIGRLLQKWITSYDREGICDDCFEDYIISRNRSRHKLWESLPSFFGLS